MTSRDTWTGSMATSQTQNRYAYANDNPTTYADPSGHCVIDTFADVAFIGYDLLSLTFGPEKDRAINAVALGADVASVFVPCVAGAGVIVRLGRAADSTADLAKGSTRARNIREQLAIEEAMSNPSAGRILDLTMLDPLWPASAGWVKVEQKVGGGQTIVHYVLNTVTGAVDDFKIKLP